MSLLMACRHLTSGGAGLFVINVVIRITASWCISIHSNKGNTVAGNKRWDGVRKVKYRKPRAS